MLTSFKKEDGAIALTTLLVVSFVLLVLATTLVLTQIDFLKSLTSYTNYTTAKLHSQSCVEEGLLRLRNNTSFTGQVNLNGTDVTCQATVSVNSSNSNYRDIVVTSTSRGNTYNHTTVISVAGGEVEIISN